ncbi:hypothetical protein QFI66_001650 [Raoultella sp. BAC10a-01-01]|uniref:DUF6841 domain-containing protein n=1 Tax=Raoultella scottii TaxID=3040937 RepID=A0ABU8Z165_9ENTR
MTHGLKQVSEQVYEWFFNEYVPKWVKVSAEPSAEDNDFILQYWVPPLYVNALGINKCLLSSDEVIFFWKKNSIPLKENEYTHTVIPSRKIVVYTENSAGIDAIWSRRRADESEIQRLAVHFGVTREHNDSNWAIFCIQAISTTEDKLENTWTILS